MLSRAARGTRLDILFVFITIKPNMVTESSALVTVPRLQEGHLKKHIVTIFIQGNLTSLACLIHERQGHWRDMAPITASGLIFPAQRISGYASP